MNLPCWCSVHQCSLQVSGKTFINPTAVCTLPLPDSATISLGMNRASEWSLYYAVPTERLAKVKECRIRFADTVILSKSPSKSCVYQLTKNILVHYSPAGQISLHGTWRDCPSYMGLYDLEWSLNGMSSWGLGDMQWSSGMVSALQFQVILAWDQVFHPLLPHFFYLWHFSNILFF